MKSKRSWPSSNPPPSLSQLKAELARREAAQELERVKHDADHIRARCTKLIDFVKEFWSVLEPNTTFIDNWHIHAICEHLEAVTDGRINRLLITVPPGSMKSLLVSVFWQAWEWGPAGKPYLRYLSTAFNDGPVLRQIIALHPPGDANLTALNSILTELA
jgi:hypothetical protein